MRRVLLKVGAVFVLVWSLLSFIPGWRVIPERMTNLREEIDQLRRGSVENVPWSPAALEWVRRQPWFGDPRCQLRSEYDSPFWVADLLCPQGGLTRLRVAPKCSDTERKLEFIGVFALERSLCESRFPNLVGAIVDVHGRPVPVTF